MKSIYIRNTPKIEKLPSRIVIKFHGTHLMPYSDNISAYLSEKKIMPWNQLTEMFPGITIKRLFTSVEPGEIEKMVKKANFSDPNMFFTYFVIDCPFEINEEDLLSRLLKLESVETAYFESDLVQPPALGIRGRNVNIGKQGYLDPAPKGINARYAWTVKGGLGENVKFIDIEQGWVLQHEDLKAANIKCLWGVNTPTYQEHGNNVLGVVLMQDNALGGVGITPSVKEPSVISQINEKGNNTIHDAIFKAIEQFNSGDDGPELLGRVLLLEIQVQDRNTGSKYWPPEIKPHIFHSIKLAVDSGIIVIEPAGNGSVGVGAVGNNFNDFPIWYGKNIFDPDGANFKDSGAIMVAAASNSKGHGKKKSSNFGSRIDCFAWGEDVYTTGDPLASIYTEDFGSTSSAAAIIAGAVISIQSINIGAGNPPLKPFQMREILRDDSNGTPSRNKIGIMPDLKHIIDNVILTN